MKILRVRNVHEALPDGIELLLRDGITRHSRAGVTLEYPEPVTTVYECPYERVLFWQQRDANPYFHFFESLWMLAGRNDVEWISKFNKKFPEFSDDGIIFHGAYGFRWRQTFEMDQIWHVIRLLSDNPATRRAVIQMWDANQDLQTTESGYKDLPCNTQIYFILRADELDMTVTNRSNDIIWGAYGSNAVHFSMLHEYIACMLQVRPGKYYQISNNFHAYKDVLEKNASLSDNARDPYRTIINNPYITGDVRAFPILNTRHWESDLIKFMDNPDDCDSETDAFFLTVALPLYHSYLCYKEKRNKSRFENAYTHLSICCASDWKLAATEWLQRREIEANRAMDDGVNYYE
ncbi:hypothetical protein CL634_08485 [bacterium]|nr:hypothetical protein [bacterium]